MTTLNPVLNRSMVEADAPAAIATASIARERIVSIDALRGLVMFTMIVVNKLGGNPLVPQWLRHWEGKGSGCTFVDLVFPAFLFIAGMSIPLSSTARGGTMADKWKAFGHVLIRTVSLLIIGVMMVNGRPDSSKMGWSANTWEFLMYAAVIATFCAFIAPKSWSADGKKRLEWANLAVRMIGAIALTYLAFAFVGPKDQRIITLSPFVINVQWWGILGHIGWAYLTASVVFLLFRGRPLAVLTCIGLMVAMYSADKAGTFAGFWPAKYVSFSAAFGTHALLTTSGMLLTMLIMTPGATAADRIRTAVWFVVACLVATFLIKGQFGINKVAATPAWGLLGCAATSALWLVLYLVSDVAKVRSISTPLALAGQNVLLAYLLSMVFNPTLQILGILNWYFRLAPDLSSAILRAIGTGIVILIITYGINRAGIRLKL